MLVKWSVNQNFVLKHYSGMSVKEKLNSQQTGREGPSNQGGRGPIKYISNLLKRSIIDINCQFATTLLDNKSLCTTSVPTDLCKIVNF